MPRNFTLIGLHVFLPINACAHECKYCLWGAKKHSKLKFSRAARLIERLAEWKYAHRSEDYLLNFDPGYSRNAQINELRAYNELNERIGNGARYSKSILLGGVRFRAPDAQTEWVRALRGIGVETMVASFAGHGAVHDRWNGREGDFSHLMDLMRRGQDIGIKSSIVLFVVRNTIPLLEELKRMIDDDLGGSAHYVAKTFNYLGASLALEDQRITEEMRNALPDWVRASSGDNFRDWRSEREWIDVILQEPEPVATTQLKLVLTEANIERLETMPVREIVAELENHTYARYRALPSLKDLCRRSGDRTSKRVYQNRLSLDGLWQDRSGEGGISLSRYSDLLREVPDSVMRPQLTPAE